jgi:ribosomal protein S18 acetylase RimI-like enzyme
MIKPITKDVLKQIKKCYQTYKPEAFIDMDETIFKQLSVALNNQGYVIHNEEFTGFLVVYPYDMNIALNPWFLNGFPIGEDSELLLQEALEFFEASKFGRVEIIGDKSYLEEKLIPLDYVYDYCDLVKVLFQENPVEMSFTPLMLCDESELKDVYHRAFSASDAKFYKYQSEEEQQDFWKHLNYNKAVKDDCSIALIIDGVLVGFIMTYPDGRKNRHVSCMCVLPEYSKNGYGTMILKQVFYLASLNGDESISLGTEKTMKAYDLYIKNGFSIKQTKSYYLKLKETFTE